MWWFEDLEPVPGGSPEIESGVEWGIVADPRHLMYLANFPVEPISWSSPPPGLLLVRRDGWAMLVIDNLAARRVDNLWVDQLEIVPWYNHADSAGDRRLAVIEHFLSHFPGSPPARIAIESRAVPCELLHGLRAKSPETSFVALDECLLVMRRKKLLDEMELIRKCIRAGEAGHARSWEVVRPGATELEVYTEIERACTEAAGQPVVVYGDFCSGPRTWTDRGGPPTGRRLERGDLMILDFSVVIGGYRGDFTNTIAVGSRPTAEQRRLFDLCVAALSAGERAVCHDASARDVFEMLTRPLSDADPELRLTGHGGHGIGLAHPEPPIIVPRSTDRLQTGDVITLEPGAYVDGVGGMRIENNYLVTEHGFERLTNHVISLTGDRS
jgi:Xaa-Pro aminopeptidase